jgi:hypothetical protein
MPTLLFNSVLGAAFVPTSPVFVVGRKVVLDFAVTTPGGVKVEWYPEYTDGNPFDLATVWFRETSEEDIGNGDVRMNEVIRRFSPNAADGVLAAGTHNLDVQLQRTHAFCRLQMRGTGVTVRLTTPFGKIPVA